MKINQKKINKKLKFLNHRYIACWAILIKIVTKILKIMKGNNILVKINKIKYNWMISLSSILNLTRIIACNISQIKK